MPMHELPGGTVPIRLWADPATVEPQALQQLYNVTTMPQVTGVAVMPISGVTWFPWTGSEGTSPGPSIETCQSFAPVSASNA